MAAHGGTGANDETAAERQARLHDLSRERPAPERVKRSDALEEMRSDRAEGLEDVRIERARRLAVDAALRQERIDVRLNEHDRRLNSINGSIERHATQSGLLREGVDKVHDEVADMAHVLRTRDAVNVALIEAAAGKGAKRLTHVQQLGIVAMALLAMASLVVAILQAVH